MKPMDPMDPRVAGWWEIKSWVPVNSDPSADQFPPGAFVQCETQANMLRPKDEALRIVWLDKDGQDCSLEYPRAATTRVTFASRTFLCGIKPELVQLDPQVPRSLQLTVTLTAPVDSKAGTGNTGTFIAQAVPGPPTYGEPGPDEPGN